MRFGEWLRVGLVLALLALGGCGGDDDDSSGNGTSTSGVGAAGGTVQGPNGAQVVIPAGALAQNTPIAVAQSSAGAPSLPSGATAVGQIFAFTPHGTTFAAPVTVTIPFDAAQVPAGATPSLYKTTSGNAGWEIVANATANASTVSGSVSSFSYIVVAAPRATQVQPPYREWTFSTIDGDSLETEKRNDSDADGGLAFDFIELGPLTIVPSGHDNVAHAEVFSNETGDTYWLSVEAPIGNAATAGSAVGGRSDLEQQQFYRKREESATLRFLVTRVMLQALDENGEEPRYSRCTWVSDTGEEGEAQCIDDVTSAVGITSALVTLGRDPERPAFTLREAHQGLAIMAGWQGNWSYSTLVDVENATTLTRHFETQAGSVEQTVELIPIFEDGQFDDFVGDSATAFDTNYTVRLRDPVPIVFDLSKVGLNEYFMIDTQAVAYALNRRGGESYVLAHLRDPASSSGLAWESTGLETVAPIPLDGPLTIEEPQCTGPGGGVVQFSADSYALTEIKHKARRVHVTRSGDTQGRAVVRLETSDGTAVAGVHYEPTSRVIVFGDGDDTPRAVDIPIVNDEVFSGANTINLTLSAVGACATIGSGDEAVVTILDDETPAPGTYTVGGTVTSLAGSGLVLEDVITGLTGTAVNNAFTIDYRYPDGGRYEVRVRTQPTNPAQSCTVANGAGTIASASVTNIVVACTTPQASGSLDATFGQGGRVVADLASSAGARAVALQSDGKLLAVGGLQLLRFNADGSPDVTFGVNGVAPIVLGTGGEAFAVAVQTDGRIVVAGHTRVGLQDDFAIARFNADGSVDAGFGASGRTSVPVYVDADTTNGRIEGRNDRAYRVLPLDDGDLLIAGHGGLGAYDSHGVLVSSSNSYAVVRLNADGSLDTGFNTTGRATLAPNGVDAALAYGAAVQSDGAIVIGGKYANATSESDLGLVRFNADGSLDQTFGPSDFGYSTQDLYGHNEEIKDLLVLPDGRIVVAALAVAPASPNPVAQFTIVSFTADGGMLGLRSTPIGTGDETTSALALQSDGKLVLVGSSREANGSNPNFGVVRYNADLTVDTTFGTNGVVTVDFFGSTDVANDVLVQPDGRIVVAGVVRNGSSWDLGLARVTP